ncbi:hypothetical protein GOV07_05060 [Candidatus Woesearchaeota archaeon]|nr:hypothetical protein [Candidatus Woesearchaeota archaeon]
MDIFAHILWTLLVFHGYDWVWWAVLLGVIADSITFFPVMIYGLLKGERFKGPPKLTGFAKKWSRIYNFTHSLIVWGAISIIILAVTGSFWMPMWGWLLHILMDIPTHDRDFFATPIFWPVSNYKLPGATWATPRAMSLIYGLVVLGWILVFLA